MAESVTLGVATLVALAIATASQSQAAPLTTKAELAVRLGYDDNVYLQDVEPSALSIAEAAADGLEVVGARQGSFVTSLLPKFSAGYVPCEEFAVNASYTPEMHWFLDESSENHVTHRGTLNLRGSLDPVTWELPNTFIYIDGGQIGPVFGAPGEIPAIGGIPMRDRREAFIFKNAFKLTYAPGKFLLRPVATAYIHDFLTEQRPSRLPFYRYLNYVDRQQITGGLDLGYTVARDTRAILGYRFGAQDQYKFLGTDSPYDNYLHRILVGVEGTPWSWMKLGVMLGPDFRDFHDERLSTSVPQFDQDEVLLYVDATVTLLPTSSDTVTLFARQYEQPAFGGPSMYEDLTLVITWRHTFDPEWSARAGFRAYAGDWQAPVDREDWIFTPSVGVTWKPHPKVNTDLAYSYDWVESRASVPRPGREFTRHLVLLTLGYTF
jgi:hypothetical protein